LKEIVTKTYASYHFGSSKDLTEQNLDALIRLFNAPNDSVASVLGGRIAVSISQLEGLGFLVVKHYSRGGLIKYFVKRRYLKWGKPRCQFEYEVLRKVRTLGVNAPEPIAYAYHGRLFYKAWLVTREIKQQQTLAELSCLDEQHASNVMIKVVDQVTRLIDNNILHVDLHPGNVLIGNDGRVFLIDFDKACLYCADRKKTLDKYLSRWQRAVTKHRLPAILSEMMSAGLKRNYEVT
jgi:tRNA A-37 threonylcarbamoyl transferase component Bud32